MDLDVLPATREDYKRKIELWFRWLSAHNIDTRSPSRSHILDYKQALITDGKSFFTVNSYITVVKLFYGYCEVRRYYNNIGVGIKSSTKQKEYYKYPLSRKQSDKLMSKIDVTTLVGKRDKLIIALMLTNGLRTCEVQRINIEDFDKEGEQTVLHIQRKGRTDKRERLAIPQVIEDLFMDYISGREFEMSDPLFIVHANGYKTQRLARQTISAIVKQRLRNVGIDNPKITAHSLRHTCGSLMVEAGVSVDDIKDILGHTTTKTTRIYIEMARQKRLISSPPSSVISSILFKNRQKPQTGLINTQLLKPDNKKQHAKHQTITKKSKKPRNTIK